MYEYKEITNNHLHETAELVLQLNNNAKDGWRCIAVTSTNMGRTAILEREINTPKTKKNPIPQERYRYDDTSTAAMLCFFFGWKGCML